ncbi:MULTISPECIES: TetR/AcrR family transcriptional regulator [Micrococcaceae]|uniref:HTH tetR-type domain-containing protein n=1 Tax=Pseudoglutamicibacter albus DNF00011 TaxID=1401063 RepID=A0A096AI42_9MICC|nr:MULTISPECIES: TetR/AcrR family transcriptional regulator [Micrococcaceae]KGF20654.1 hypothetical protein HMPREF2128_04265 [Pseudoglutamicibacter albus DNF00011]
MTQAARRMPRDERRAQLMGVAQRTFSQHGYFAASMDLIAENAGVSKPVLYQHFSSKLDLYVALLEHELDSLVLAVREALNASDDPFTTVRSTVEAYFDFVAREGSAHELVFESDLSHEATIARRLRQFRDTIGLEIGQKLATFTSLDQFEATYLGLAVTAAAERAAGLWQQTSDEMTRECASELVWRLAWRGIDGYLEHSTTQMP